MISGLRIDRAIYSTYLMHRVLWYVNITLMLTIEEEKQADTRITVLKQRSDEMTGNEF